MKVAAITGLEAEARIARRAGLTALASGGMAERTLAIAEACLADGADALVSFGIAGALAPHLSAGSLLLPRCVVDDGGARFRVDEAWRARIAAMLEAAGMYAEEGDILGAAEAVASPVRKAALFQKTGAIAVDLESHRVAVAAARARLPFVVMRAVADPASRDLPPAALVPLTKEGHPGPAIISSIARHPLQVSALLHLAGDARRALATLRQAGEALRSGLVSL